jgi:hypothetical protein
MFVKTLADWLRDARFEPEQIHRIVVCAPVIAAAIIEWMRLDAFPRTHVDLTRYHDLRRCAGDPLAR